jgi:Mor family transcriptional regulator
MITKPDTAYKDAMAVIAKRNAQIKKDHARGVSLSDLGRKHGVSRQRIFALVQ